MLFRSAAQSLLAAELAYVDTCIETGLLNPEEGAAFRDAVSYVRYCTRPGLSLRCL